MVLYNIYKHVARQKLSKIVKSFKEVDMFTDKYESAESGIVADYMKGYVLPKTTNSIHCHEEYEFLLIVNGEITYADNKGVIKMNEKSLVFTRAHDVHNPSASTTRLYERYRIAFKTDVISSLPFSHNVDELVSSSYKKALSDEELK